MSEKNINVLALSRYGGMGASSRLRTAQYANYLGEHGISLTQVPLFTDSYLSLLYSTGFHSVKLSIAAYIERFIGRISYNKYDLWWIEKEIFPWVPYCIEFIWSLGSPSCVVDYDDAIFHNYDLSKKAHVRYALGGKIDRIMRRSELTIVGNDYLAQRARSAGAKEVVIVPTAIELVKYGEAKKINEQETFTIGWIGTPKTAKYLERLRSALDALIKMVGDGRVRLLAIGSGPLDWNGLPVEVHPWTESTEVDDIKSCDVGVMPLPDDPWERGKCGYKLIQYMACGLPVVASPVGVNREIVQVGVNGFLAETETEWVAALDTLRRDPDLRRRMGAAGRRMVEERYCVEVIAPRLAQLLRSAAGR